MHTKAVQIAVALVLAVGLVAAVTTFAGGSTTMRVSVTPGGALKGLQVSVTGAGCSGTKTIETKDYVEFAGCTVGERVNVHVPQSFNGHATQEYDQTFTMTSGKQVTFTYGG